MLVAVQKDPLKKLIFLIFTEDLVLFTFFSLNQHEDERLVPAECPRLPFSFSSKGLLDLHIFAFSSQ